PPTVAKNQYNEKTAQPAAKTEPAKASPPPEPTSKAVVVPDDDAEKPLVIEGGLFDHLVDSPVEDVRPFAGTTRPQLPETLTELWEEGLEREYLTFVANNQIPSQTAQRIMEFYAEMFVVSSGMSPDSAIKAFHAKFADVPKSVREKLVEFYLTD